MTTNYRPGKSAYDYGHEGKGPKGWRRADSRITEDVCENLKESSFVDATNIDVNVEEGVVRLTGTVNGRFAKREAEWCADRVDGVVDVLNELKVRQAYPGKVQSSYGGPLNPGSVANQRADDIRD